MRTNSLKDDLVKRVSAINAAYAKANKIEDGSARVMFGSELPRPEIISTGNPALDWALGGGIPQSTIFELYGPPASSKTVSMAYIMRQVQNAGKYVIYYHTEESLPPYHAWELAGVDKEMVFYIPSKNYGEDGVNLIRKILIDEKTKIPDPAIGMIVIDSLTSIAPQAEVNSIEEKGAEGVTMSRHAAFTSKFFRDVCGTNWMYNGCIIGYINQERTNLSSYYVSNQATGGNAPRYYAKIRIRLVSGNKSDLILDEDKNVIGATVNFTVTKNNTGVPPYRSGSWIFKYGIGLDVTGPIITEATSYGLIQLAGRTYTIRWIDEAGEVFTKTVVGKKNMEEAVVNGGISDHLLRLHSIIRSEVQAGNLDFAEGVAIVNDSPVDIIDYLKSKENGPLAIISEED